MREYVKPHMKFALRERTETCMIDTRGRRESLARKKR
jgi:hypothetical protein